MDYVEGKIYKDPSLPGLSPDERKAVYGAMNKTIAKIHSVDVDKAGIADYGKHGETIITESNCDSDNTWQATMCSDRCGPGPSSTRPVKRRI